MAISDGTAGAWVATTTRNPTVTLPAHSAGQMLIVRMGWKSATPTTDVAVCNTSGWAKLGQYYNGGGVSSNGGGGVLVAVFYKEATSSSETNPVIEFDDATAPTPGAYCAVSYSKGASEAWATPEGASGSIAAATAYTSTMSTHVSCTAGDMLDAFAVTNDNTTLTVPTVTQTGVTFDTVTEYPATALSSNTSNDISADGRYRLASSGTSSAAAVVSGTNSVADPGAAWVTRLRVVPTVLSSFTASAVIKSTVSGSFSADAVVAKVQSVSFSADAVVSKTETGSLATDAAIRREQTGSFSASAVIRREQVGSFFADADIAVSVTVVPGDFASDAVILRSQAGGISTDSVVGKTTSGSFSANAVVGFPVLNDTFTRTVSTGLGLGYSFLPVAGSLYTEPQASVNGSELVYDPTLSGSEDNTERYAYVRIRSGVVQFDILAAGPGVYDSQVQVFTENHFILVDNWGDDTWQASIDDGAIARAITTFTLTGPTWLTVKASIAASTGRCSIKIWERGQPEPDWMASGNSYTSSTSHLALLELYSSNTDPDSGHRLDNLILTSGEEQWVGYGVLRASSVVQRTREGSFSADAVIGRTQSGSLLSDAVIAATATGSLSASAVIRLDQVGSFTADSVVRAAITGTFSADAAIATLAGYDDFNRTVATNWGQASSGFWWRPRRGFETGFNAGNGYADGSSGVTALTKSTHLIGYPLIRHGVVQFDFYVDGFSSQTFYSFDTLFDEIKVQQANASQFRLVTNALYQNFNVTADTWYTVKVTTSDTLGTIVSGKVWQVGQPEPDWQYSWEQTYLTSLRYAQQDSTTVDYAKVDNIYWWTSGPIYWETNFYASSVLLKTQATGKTFPADAVIAATSTSSLSADAVIKKTQTGSFSASSVIRVEQPGSFSASASIAKLVFEDDFNRTVGSGWGTSSWGTPWVELPVFAGDAQYVENSVNGSEAVQPVKSVGDLVGRALHYGLRFVSSGIVQFDFWLQSSPTGWFWYQVGTRYWYIRVTPDNSSGSPLTIQTNGAYITNFTPSTYGAWYTVKASFAASAGVTQYLKVWKRGDAEPDWMASGNSFLGTEYRYGYIEVDSGTNEESKLDNLRIWATSEGVGVVYALPASAVIGRTQSGSFTADAFIQRTTTGPLSADAVIRHTQTGSISASAVILRTRSGSLAADAVIAATQSGSFSADAAIAATATGTFSADAVIAATVTGSFSVDAIVMPFFTADAWLAGRITADAFITAGQYGFASADAAILATVDGSIGSNAVLVREIDGSFDASSHLLLVATGSLTSDAAVLREGSSASAADSIIQRTTTESISADAVVVKSQAASLSADALLCLVAVGSLTADSNIAGTPTGSLTSDAWISAPGYSAFSADSVIFAQPSFALTSDAVLSVERTSTFTAESTLVLVSSGYFSADSSVQITQTGTFTTDGLVSQTSSATFSGSAVIGLAASAAFTADAAKLKSSTGALTADAVVSQTRTGGFASDAIFRSVVNGSLSADAWIFGEALFAFSSDATILAAGSGSFVASSVIAKVESSSITADAWLGSSTGGLLSADAVVAAAGQGSIGVDASILKTQGGSISADAYVLSTNVGLLLVDAAITLLAIDGLTADAVLLASSARTFSADASITEWHLGNIEATSTAETIGSTASASTFEATSSARTLAFTILKIQQRFFYAEAWIQ